MSKIQNDIKNGTYYQCTKCTAILYAFRFETVISYLNYQINSDYIQNYCTHENQKIEIDFNTLEMLKLLYDK